MPEFRIARLLTLLVVAGTAHFLTSHTADAAPRSQDSLTETEEKQGVGPLITEMELGPVDDALAAQGAIIFADKCAVCHQMEESDSGPPLGRVLERRTPAYLMNMILNPIEMAKKHPEAKKLFEEHQKLMPFQDITAKEARMVVEFLRASQRN